MVNLALEQNVQEMCDLNSIRWFMTRDLLEVTRLIKEKRGEDKPGGDKKEEGQQGATRKALCYMRIVFQVCEILQSNEEGELEELLNLEVKTSLVIFPERNFRSLLIVGECGLGGYENQILRVENKVVQYQVQVTEIMRLGQVRWKEQYLQGKQGSRKVLGGFSVSQGCQNKLPQTEWLKRTEIYSLIVLEARSPKSKHCQAMLPLTVLVKNPSLPLSGFQGLLSVVGIPGLIDASLQSLPLSSDGCLPSVCLCVKISFSFLL